jgi:hypothetical protein
MQIVGSREILVDSLNLDEDAAVPPCELKEKCAYTVQIQGDTNVKLNRVNIYNGKGYVVFVWSTNGFSFSNSAISEAGIIGLYVGHFSYGPSSNIAITNSVFARTRTNAIAFLGANGESSDPVLVTGNIFTRNHWHGLWLTDQTKYPAGTVTGGGELFIAEGHNLRIVNNIIADGYCVNCYPGPAIAAVEVGGGNTPGVSGLVIDNNHFYNGGNAPAIYQNPGAKVLSVQIENNNVAGWPVLTNIHAGPGNTIAGNDGKDVIPSLSQGGKASYQVLRDKNGSTAREGQERGGLHGSTSEAVFGLSPSPRLGAPARPLFRCVRNSGSMDEYISREQNCEGAGTLHSVAGYSYEDNYSTSHAKQFYRCKRADSGRHFVSWDSKCEGQITEFPLGYAQVVTP